MLVERKMKGRMQGRGKGDEKEEGAGESENRMVKKRWEEMVKGKKEERR